MHLLIAAPFQTVTLAILPLSMLAGAIRNLRAHFGDQVFLLHNRTRWMMAIAAIDASMTVVLSALFLPRWGLHRRRRRHRRWRPWPPYVSFSIGFTVWPEPSGRPFRSHRIGNDCDVGTAAGLPGSPHHRCAWRHMLRPALPPISRALALLYAPSLLRMLRSKPPAFGGMSDTVRTYHFLSIFEGARHREPKWLLLHRGIEWQRPG